MLETAPAKATTAGRVFYTTGANAIAENANIAVTAGGQVRTKNPSCRAHRTTTLALSTSLQAINFDSESGDWDNDSLHSTSSNTHRFTASAAGVYAFHCAISVSYGSGSPTNVVLAARDSSGNSLARSNSVSLLVNSVGECNVAGQVKLAAADWIDFAAAFNGSGAASVAADAASTPCKAGISYVSDG